jgi:hypothetical protein
MNSLSAIAGHEGDEEDWDIGGEIGRYSVHDDEVSAKTQHPRFSILMPSFSSQNLSRATLLRLLIYFYSHP